MTHPRADLGLLALVLHARHVESEEREAFAAAAASVASDPRVILVRTCHRVELYVVDELLEGHPLPPLPALPPAGRRLEGVAAARHVFMVAAGLDSVVVGEDQILHQLRECLSDRRVPSAESCPEPIGSPSPLAIGLHPVLERLFQIALHLGRETRSWREGPPRSLADSALDRLLPFTGPLLGRRLLVVGAGRMARLAAVSASRRGAHVLVANRSSDRAAALAYDVNGEPAAFGPEAPLPDVDGVVVAINAPWPLSPAARDAVIARELPIADLSSPPSLDAELRVILAERHVSVDDLARDPRDQMRARLRRRFERVLDAAETRFTQWVATRASVPAIQALSDRAETRRLEELDRLFRRLDLADHQRELVEQMSHRLVAGLLHDPLATLRDDSTGDLERAARTLFSL